MSDYLEVAYKDSDYTIGIALMCWQKHIILEHLNKAEYELVDANRVCPGIHKVRVRPHNMRAFATCYTPGIKKIVLHK